MDVSMQVDHGWEGIRWLEHHLRTFLTSRYCLSLVRLTGYRRHRAFALAFDGHTSRRLLSGNAVLVLPMKVSECELLFVLRVHCVVPPSSCGYECCAVYSVYTQRDQLHYAILVACTEHIYSILLI